MSATPVPQFPLREESPDFLFLQVCSDNKFLCAATFRELTLFACACTKAAMRASFHELGRLVLEAVSEEYQSFETVVSKLSRSNFAYREVMEIERVLLSSIEKKLVAAYLIHADPPYATEVAADSDSIRRYWFCITEEGRKHLARLIRKQTVQTREG